MCVCVRVCAGARMYVKRVVFLVRAEEFDVGLKGAHNLECLYRAREDPSEFDHLYNPRTP